MSFGACVLNCGQNKGNVKRGVCEKCGLSGLCEKCRALPCPTHRVVPEPKKPFPKLLRAKAGIVEKAESK